MPAAKAALKKSSSKKVKPLKYSDKSEHQAELIPVFNEIRNILCQYQKGALKANSEGNGQIHLWSEKEAEVAGRKFDRLFFAGAMIQKGFVGFYFMPVYVQPKLKEKLSPELLKCLKGKSCFHIKKNDALIMQQIKQALDTGLKCYDENGWI